MRNAECGINGIASGDGLKQDTTTDHGYPLAAYYPRIMNQDSGESKSFSQKEAENYGYDNDAEDTCGSCRT